MATFLTTPSQLQPPADLRRLPIPFSYLHLKAAKDEMSTTQTRPSASLAFAVIATAVSLFTLYATVQNTVAQEKADGPSKRSAPSTLRFVPLNAENTPYRLERAKITGGWLVTGSRGGAPDSGFGLTFVPDPEHQWDGGSRR